MRKEELEIEEEELKVSPQCIARTIVLILSLINQILAIFGKETFDFVESDIYQLVSIIFTLISAFICWWKDNNFTKKSIALHKKS